MKTALEIAQGYAISSGLTANQARKEATFAQLVANRAEAEAACARVGYCLEFDRANGGKEHFNILQDLEVAEARYLATQEEYNRFRH